MSDATELAAIRSSTSLAAQVIHQCRVLGILRDNPEDAARLLLDPIALQQALDARYGRHFQRCKAEVHAEQTDPE
jgi:hypothetical protein